MAKEGVRRALARPGEASTLDHQVPFTRTLASGQSQLSTLTQDSRGKPSERLLAKRPPPAGRLFFSLNPVQPRKAGGSWLDVCLGHSRARISSPRTSSNLGGLEAQGS
ncbi:hypothetical protein KM043_010243 [Ampulex compressa]|nr:hypothetical protein KM043_010243 [Ampulex compressa]